jgi:GNAT superfamily N-acetyltransferase
LRLEELVAPAVESGANPDPSAPEVRRFGDTIASKGGQGAPADNVFCFGSRDLGRLDEILEFYAVDGLEPSFYLVPMTFTPDVAEALSRKGFAQRNFEQAILYGAPRATTAALPAGMTIERVSSATCAEFARATADGFEWPPEWRDAAVAGLIQSFHENAWHFLARFDGVAAGVASLVIRDGVARLNDSAVVPDQRRRGCHLALIQHRLNVARELGCSLVLGAANFGSGSFRNQQRAGLQLAYIESEWRRFEEG